MICGKKRSISCPTAWDDGRRCAGCVGPNVADGDTPTGEGEMADMAGMAHRRGQARGEHVAVGGMLLKL